MNFQQYYHPQNYVRSFDNYSILINCQCCKNYNYGAQLMCNNCNKIICQQCLIFDKTIYGICKICAYQKSLTQINQNSYFNTSSSQGINYKTTDNHEKLTKNYTKHPETVKV